ncbi:MAG: SRPBCC family protein [Acidobacteria bacterium]|nr:SRPBCC family protein [Acidobacteriota bacterium]
MSNASHSIDVSVSLDRAYAVWRDFENWPRFIPFLAEVHDTGDRTAIARVSTPVGKVECHIELANEHPGESFQWHTMTGDVDFLGKVSFTELAPNSTRVSVDMEYHAPLGKIGEALARVLHEDPCSELPTELASFKDYVEGSSAASA